MAQARCSTRRRIWQTHRQDCGLLDFGFARLRVSSGSEGFGSNNLQTAILGLAYLDFLSLLVRRCESGFNAVCALAVDKPRLQIRLDAKSASSCSPSTTQHCDMAHQQHRQTPPTASNGDLGGLRLGAVASVLIGLAALTASIWVLLSAPGLTSTNLDTATVLRYTIFALIVLSTILMFDTISRLLRARPHALPTVVRSTLPYGWLASQTSGLIFVIKYCLRIYAERQPTGLTVAEAADIGFILVEAIIWITLMIYLLPAMGDWVEAAQRGQERAALEHPEAVELRTRIRGVAAGALDAMGATAAETGSDALSGCEEKLYCTLVL